MKALTSIILGIFFVIVGVAFKFSSFMPNFSVAAFEELLILPVFLLFFMLLFGIFVAGIAFIISGIAKYFSHKK